DERGWVGEAGQGLARPAAPGGILGRDVENDVAVDEDGAHSPRVSAMISSVDILTVPLPRRRRSTSAPRPPRRAPLTFTRRTTPRSKTKSTSVFGSSPAFCRISSGIVTWPFDVMRMRLSLLLPVRVRRFAGDVKPIRRPTP